MLSLRVLLVALPAVFLAACGDTRNPTAPTSATQVSFDDRFWRELIYNEWERGPRGLGLLPESRIVSVQRNYSIEAEGMPERVVRSIQESIPVLWEQLTGEPFAGEIIIGRRFPVPAWTTINNDRIVSTQRLCGAAGIPTEDGPNSITLDLAEPVCADNFLGVFAHEFGHDLGLHHVGDATALMASDGRVKTAFTEKEKYHAQLAYRVGPGMPYCGHPLGASCQ